MTNAELIEALRKCGKQSPDRCWDCEYYDREPWCESALAKDAADALEAADKRIDGLQKLVDINTERCEDGGAGMNVELKPCPFCGKVPVMESSDYDPRATRYIIRCANPKCRILPHTDYHIYKAVITREWNRRANDEADC